MLVQDTVNLCQQVIEEYNATGIINILESARIALALRGTPNEGAYPDHAKQVRNEALNIIKARQNALASPEMVAFLEQATISHLTPYALARRVYSLVNENITNAGVSSEAASLKAQAMATTNLLTQFQNVSAVLGMSSIVFRPQSLSLRTTLPAVLYDEELGKLGVILEKLSDFVGNVTEFASGSRDTPKVDYASTSVLQIWQSVSADQVVHVLNGLKACFDAVKSGLELKKSINALKKLNVSDEQIRPIVEGHEARRDAELERNLLALLVGSAATIEPGRQMELKQQVVSSAKYVTRQIEGGLEIVVERRSETSETMTAMLTSGSDQAKVLELIGELRSEQKRIATDRENIEQALLEKPNSRS